MWRAIIIVILSAAVAGGVWWWHHPTHPAPVNASIYETDMTEGLLREILAGLERPVPSVCFLAFGDGGTSPSREFIARFAGSQPAVRSYESAAAPPTGQFFETATGRPGLVVHIIRFREVVPGTFDVVVSFSNLPAGHDEFTYRIGHVTGEWKIKSRKPA